jgi:DNA-binding IclR family transcriptional regulator
MAQEDGAAGLNVLAKAQSAVEEIARRGPLTAADLATRLDEPASSVYRLLTNLTQARWLERGDVRGEYRLGSRFLWLSDRLEGQLDVRSAALPSLRVLNSATRQTSFLCVRSGDRATCIERLDGQDVQIQRLRVGASLPLHEGAAPRVLLAFQPGPFVDDYFASSFPKTGDSRRAREELTQIVTRGYAVADDEAASGIRSVGAPIFDHRGQVTAAISVSGLSGRLIVDSDETVQLVRTEAAAASTSLGYTPDQDA